MRILLSCSIGLVLFVTTFVGSVVVRDAYEEGWLKENVVRIQPGMPESELIEILGKPTSYHMSDEPGTYWCYGSNSFNTSEEYCDKVMVLMGSNNRVIEVGAIVP